MDEQNLSSRKDTSLPASPQALALFARHPMGPLARLSGLKLRVPAVTFALGNGEPRLLAYSLSLAPLEREQDGGSVEGDLSASHGAAAISAGGGPLAVEAQPGKAIEFHLSARGAFPPGRYLSGLHVRGADSHHLVPITITITSHWLWSFIFLLLGLLFLGFAGYMTGASDISARKEEAQSMRRSLHELLDRLPPGESGKAVAVEADERLTHALELLGMPRPWSVRDWRLLRVDEELSAVRRQLPWFREDTRRRVSGEAEVKNLTREWMALEERLAAVERQFKSVGQGLPASYEAFLRTRYQALIIPALSVVREQLGPHVEQVRVAYGAGEGGRAQVGAARVRYWLRNGAGLLDERVSLLMAWRQLCEEAAARQAALEAAAYYPETPVDWRWKLRERLKDIRWAFANRPPSEASFRELYVRLQQMEADILKMQSTTLADEAAQQHYCARLASEVRAKLRNAGNLLALVPHAPAVVSLKEGLGRMHQELDQLPEKECLQRLMDLDARALNAGHSMMALLSMAGGTSPESRPAQAGHGDVLETAALASRLMTEPRQLRLVPRGRADEWQIGREIILRVQDLDPAWGADVHVAIDFGDGSPPVVMSVEELRRGTQVAHRYLRPQWSSVRIVAAESFLPESITPTGELLGHGSMSLDIGPSRISNERELAGHLFNLRFLIALGIGLLVQGGRFYSDRSKRPFGAMRRDYAETFALGLGIDAGIRIIAEILAGAGLNV